MADGDWLPDEALVVRCGLPPFGQPTNLPLRCDHHDGVYGFSVQSAAGITLDRLASWCRNRRVGIVAVETIRALGYDVKVTQGKGYHATLIVPLDWNQQAADELAATFESVANPTPGENR